MCKKKKSGWRIVVREGKVYRETDVARIRTHVDEMSLYRSSSSSGWWIYGCSLLSCFVIYVDYVRLCGYSYVYVTCKYFKKAQDHKIISYWDNKRTKFSVLWALALVRNELSFIANVAPDFLCFLYLLVKQFWAFSKFMVNTSSTGKCFYAMLFLTIPSQ